MTQLFSIKPLEWRQTGSLFMRPSFQAESLIGVLTVGEIEPGEFVAFTPGGNLLTGESLEDGKAKAEAYYRACLMTALHPEGPPHDAA